MPQEPGYPFDNDNEAGLPQEQPAEQKRAFGSSEKVLVRRSSGKIEADWIVDGYDGENVIVKKREKNGRIIKKHIPEGELKALQEEARIGEEELEALANPEKQDIDPEKARAKLLIVIDRSIKEVKIQKKGDPHLEEFLAEYQKMREELVGLPAEQVMQYWNEVIAEEKQKLEKGVQGDSLKISLPEFKNEEAKNDFMKRLDKKREQYLQRHGKYMEEYSKLKAEQSQGNLAERAQLVIGMVDTMCKMVMVEKLLSGGEVDMNKVTQELRSQFGASLDAYMGILQDAYGVIKNYCEEGGKGVIGGKGF